MCGITGFFDLSALFPDQILKKMTDSLAHRGPDDEGLWWDPEVGIALGHRRLSIIDLSPAGHQPMHSASGRYVTIFNGEIYNHHLIRAELENLAQRNWRGHSDTEVMLEAFETWGVEATLKRLVGMFAVALWDRRERVLHLMRDRVGEKPLYYGQVGTAFLFASELKAFVNFPQWNGTINRNALTLYLRHNCIPAPYTIYEGIKKLLPGTLLSLSLHPGVPPDMTAVKTVSFWSAKKTAEHGLATPFTGTEEQAMQQLDRLLREAIGQQMVADVPLGVFLSGGVDSSTIAALMQAQSSLPVKTFTIGFREEGYNEAEDAKAVARYLGTEHTELYINSSDALAVIPKLATLYDEPFSDSSQIPTYLVSLLTRKHVAVSLSGDAGDELFGGYNRYSWGANIWRKISRVPVSLRTGLARGICSMSPLSYDRLFRALAPFFPSASKRRAPGDQLHKLAEILDAPSPLEIYRRLVSHWKDPSQIVLNGNEPATILTDESSWLDSDDFTVQMMYMDLVSYLVDDILVKVDRAAMGVSLETRVPFLDHRVVEFAWRIPLSMKIRNGQGKWLLRQVLYKYVPQEMIERPKVGFGVPIDTWLRGPLREWATSLLDERRLRNEGFFNPQLINKKWLEHLSGKRNWQYHLWDILMFQAWLENSKGLS